MRSATRFVPAALVVFIALAGCSSSPGVKKVTGMVKMNGGPVEGAHVRFVPKNDPELGEFGGYTGADGKFTIRVGGPGMVAKPGLYIALITKGEAMGVTRAPKTEEELRKAMKASAPGLSDSSALPERFSDPRTSPFEVDIKDGTTELEPFDLGTDLGIKP
jgi:hypothetical protein